MWITAVLVHRWPLALIQQILDRIQVGTIGGNAEDPNHIETCVIMSVVII